MISGMEFYSSFMLYIIYARIMQKNYLNWRNLNGVASGGGNVVNNLFPFQNNVEKH